jgi:hypothetical protein
MACPQATFFHRAGWQRILRDVFRHDTYFLYAERGRAHRRRAAAGARQEHAVRQCAGACRLRCMAAWPPTTPEEAAARWRAEAQRAGAAVGRAAPGTAQPVERATRLAQQDLYVTFRKAILPDEEANMLAIPRKQRAMVRKGIKNGLKSEHRRRRGPLLRAVCRQRAPPRHAGHAQALLPGAAREFGADCEVLTVTGPDGKPLSSVLSFYFRDEVLPYYAGDDEAARDLAANDFKYWELMRRPARAAEGVRLRPQQAGHRPLRLQEELGLRAARRCTTSTACTSATPCRRTTPTTPSTSC